MRIALFAAAALLAACSPPADKGKDEAPPSPTPIAACNEVGPDFSKLVTVQEATPALMSAAELRGGPINPGTYDLVSAVRVGQATAWDGARAVALDIVETEAGVILHWAGGAPGGALDTWDATLTDTPSVSISYTCGRVGTVDAAFVTYANRLELRIQDGASGALHMTFERRGA
jgi:hypothetical protein